MRYLIVLLTSYFLYGLEVDMVRFELIHQNKAENIGENFLLRIDEDRNLYAITDTNPYSINPNRENQNILKKYNAKGELLWSKAMEQEPLEPPTDKSIVLEENRFINIEYFKNHIYTFSVYRFKRSNEYSHIYEIAKYNADGKLINRQSLFKVKKTTEYDSDYWSISHIYNGKIYFIVGNFVVSDYPASSFAGIYNLNNDQIKPIETIKIDDELTPTQMEVGEYGVYIAYDNLLKKYDLQGNPLWTEEIEGDKKDIHIFKILADSDIIYFTYKKEIPDIEYFIIAYDHNKKSLWHKIDEIHHRSKIMTNNEVFYGITQINPAGFQVFRKYDKKNGKVLFEKKIDFTFPAVMMPHQNGISIMRGLSREYLNYNHQNQLTFKSKFSNDYSKLQDYSNFIVYHHNKKFFREYLLYSSKDGQTGYVFKPHFTKCTLPSDSFDINAFTSLGKGWYMLASGDTIKDLCVFNQLDHLYLVDYSKPDNLHKIKLNSLTTPKDITIKPFEGFLVYNNLPDDLEVIYDRQTPDSTKALTKEYLDNLPKGFHILGSGIDINDTSILKSMDKVFLHQGDDKLKELDPKLDQIPAIKAYQGFWGFKE